MLLCMCYLVVPQLLSHKAICEPSHPHPTAETCPTSTDSKVYSRLSANPMTSETFPCVSHGSIFFLNYCSIYWLSAPDWVEGKKLFLDARYYTRSHLIFTTFLWSKYSCFILQMGNLARKTQAIANSKRNGTMSAVSDSVLVTKVMYKVWRCSRF